MFKFLMYTKPFKLAPAYLSSFISRPLRALHTDTFSCHLSSTRNVLQSGSSILQTPECLSDHMAGNCQAQGRYPSGTAFFYPASRLQLLGGAEFITRSYNPFCGQGLCLVHSSPKREASKTRLWGKRKSNDRRPKTDARSL